MEEYWKFLILCGLFLVEAIVVGFWAFKKGLDKGFISGRFREQLERERSEKYEKGDQG